MRVRILLPHKIFLDDEIKKVVVEAENGAFGILPRHIDFVTTLIPGILTLEDHEGHEKIVAVDEGVLVKQGNDLLISTRNAIQEDDLTRLQKTVNGEFLNFDEHERKARSASSMLEADFIRKFINLEQL